MNPRSRDLIVISTAAVVLALGIGLSPPLTASALAQASDMAGIGQTATVSLRATVKTVDQRTRSLTLVGPQGETITLRVGDEVHNLPQVKPGDTVIARYHAAVAYVLAPPGTKLPENRLTLGAVRAAPGQMPAGAIGAKLVVSGLVVGVDPVAKTISLVDPSGGRIRTIDVVTQEGRQNMKLIKVGDTITAVITDAVAASVEPAT